MIITPQIKAPTAMNRMGFIGGSDIPIILGMSTYKSPLELYLEKTGQKENAGFEDNELQKWGKLLEPIIMQEYANSHSVEIQTQMPESHHPNHPHLIGHLDGYVADLNRVVEIKCANNFTKSNWGEENSDEMYLPYLCQVAFYCALTNANDAMVAVLFGGYNYREYHYKRDLDLEASIIAKANEFWDRIINKNPPEPMNVDDLKLLFPTHAPDKISYASPDIRRTCADLFQVKQEIKLLGQTQDNLKFDIMRYMQDAECLKDAKNDTLVTWKSNKRGSRVFLSKGE